MGPSPPALRAPLSLTRYVVSGGDEASRPLPASCRATKARWT